MNQTTVNTLIEDTERIRNVFFSRMLFIFLGDEEVEVGNGRFFRDCSDLAESIDKIFDKYDDQPSIYHTGDNYRYFKKIGI